MPTFTSGPVPSAETGIAEAAAGARFAVNGPRGRDEEVGKGIVGSSDGLGI